MKIEQIDIKNFKGLNEATFNPKSFTCLVGENNAGKSSVLQAVVYALNRPGSLPRSLFYDESQPIEFKCTFSSVTDDHLNRLAEEHKPKIEQLVYDEKFYLIVRYRCDEKVEIKILKKVPTAEQYRDEKIDELFKGTRGSAVREVVENNYVEWLDNFPNGANLTQAKTYIKEKIQQLPPNQFQLDETVLPSGISASITSLLPEPIYIPAVKNINDDLKTTQSTSFGRLLGLLLEDMSPDLDEFNNSLESLKKLLNRVVDEGVEIDERHKRVKDLENLVEEFLSENFPRVKVELEIPPPELKTILNTAQIWVDDGSKDLIDHKGDGIKRSLTFALLRSYVHQLEKRREEQAVVHGRPLCFLFEEPELYLHPRSQKILFNTLGSISNDHQVILSTHSPLFFAPGVTASFVRIAKKDAAPKPIGILHPVDFELDDEQAQNFKLARFENADAGFFSSKVLLFEGESDDFFMRHVARKINPEWNFDRANIGLIRIGGKGNFQKFRKFFDCFGINVVVIADLDVIFDGYEHLCASNKCHTLRGKIIQLIDKRIDELRIKAETTSERIKRKINQESWKVRYEAAKEGLRECQQTRIISDEVMEKIDGIFTWEESDARLKAVLEDEDSRVALIPLLDSLREEGICVLSKGSLENYYPDGVPEHGPKPERALKAIDLLPDRDTVLKISNPLTEGRLTEFEEIFDSIFN
jgi:putative ATP-dependent endonuclease of the OLD family